jgi:hypothetical protein
LIQSCLIAQCAERHGFEYCRHGTLSLYAALDMAGGWVHGKTTVTAFAEELRTWDTNGPSASLVIGPPNLRSCVSENCFDKVV